MKQWVFLFLLGAVLFLAGCGPQAGNVSAGVYRSAYADIGWALTPGWDLQTPEETQAHRRVELLARNSERLEAVSVSFTALTPGERLAMLFLSDEDLAQLLAGQPPFPSDWEIASVKADSVIFLGNPRPALRVEGTQQGVPLYGVCILDGHLGSEAMTLTAYSYETDRTQALLDEFYQLS